MANSYATSVAVRTLTLAKAGVLLVIAEFPGAVALGANVTNAIESGIIGLDRFRGDPATLILPMTCAEIGNATWLLVATRLRFPISTTHTIVGAFVGVGIIPEATITWRWTDGSISQIAASWGITPLILRIMGYKCSITKQKIVSLVSPCVIGGISNTHVPLCKD